MGGGAMHMDLPITQFKASSSKRPSLSSSSKNLPVSANHSSPLRPSRTHASCSSDNETCRRLESADGRKDKRASGSFYDLVFRLVPSQFEVESAIAALQNFMLGISSSGSELKWLQPVLENFDSRILPSQGYRRVYDAFRLLHTDPSIKRLVVSLSSDKAVWDAVMNNELVRKLQESIGTAEDGRPQSSNEGPDLVSCILRWILDISKAKIMELIEKFNSLLNEIFQPRERRNPAAETIDQQPTAETIDQLDDKVRSSVLLSVVILLIVVVARVHKV